MNTGGRRSIDDGSASGDESDAVEDDTGEASRLVPSSSPVTRFLSRLPRFHRRTPERDAAGGYTTQGSQLGLTALHTIVKRNCSLSIVRDILETIRTILWHSWVNVALIFVPLGIVSYLVHLNHVLIFVANVLAVIPLSSLLTYATEEIARESSDVVGALMNVTFGNLVEILLFIALSHNRLAIVQASLVGSILVNLLPVLGIAMFAGSIRQHQLSQNREAAQVFASLLGFSVVSLLVPNAFYHSFADLDTANAAVLTLSRVSSLTLLPIYLLFIFVQIRAMRHNIASADIRNVGGAHEVIRANQSTGLGNPAPMARSIRFQDEESASGYTAKDLDHQSDTLELSALDGSEGSHVGGEEIGSVLDFDPSAPENEFEPQQQLRPKTLHPRNSIYQHPSRRPRSNSHSSTQRDASPSDQQRARHRSSFNGSSTSLPRLLVGSSVTSMDNLRDVYRSSTPPLRLGRTAASILLVVSALLVAICAEFLVDTIDNIVESGAFFSEAFIGLIILPAAGNFAELFTATAAAWDGNFDLAVGVSVGSSVQISLLVTPLVVIGGWIMHKEMTMCFDLFGTVALFATTFLVTILILHGKSRLLEGSLLIACYFIIGVGAFLFPRPDDRAR